MDSKELFIRRSELRMKEGLTGYLELGMQSKKGSYSAKTLLQKGASRISPAMYLDTSDIPCYFMLSLGGGFVAGDVYENKFTLEKNAKVILTTQSPNKIFKSPNQIPAIQKTFIHLEEGSQLEYISDSLIAYEDAYYVQDTRIDMTENASLVYIDGITSGWAPTGEKFKYEEVKLKTHIYMDGQPVVLDYLKLTPKSSTMQALGMLEEYTQFGTMMVIDSRITDSMIKEMRMYIEQLGKPVRYGLSTPQCNGFVLRVLGNLTQDIEKVIERCHDYIREQLYDIEPLRLRKY